MAKLSPRFSLGGARAKFDVKSALEFTELVKNVLNIIGTVGPVILAFLGVTASFGGPASGLAISIAGAPFPIRLLIFMLISIGLGWSLAALISWFTSMRREAAFLSAHLLALTLGTLMIGSADWLAKQGEGGHLPQQHFFAAVGFGLVFALLRFRFQASGGFGGLRLLHVQSGIILNFAASAFVVLLLLELTNLG